MPERLNGPDSKSGELAKTGSVGSNPTLSARVIWLGVFFGLSLLVFAPPAWAGATLRLGAGRLTDQVILAHLAALVLEDQGVEVALKSGLDPEVLRHALLEDQLDLYWEYTGRALVVYQRNPDREVLKDPARCHQAVKEADTASGLFWGAAAPADQTYAILMDAAKAKKLGIETISDLAGASQDQPFNLGADKEFLTRPDGYKALAAVFGLKLPLTSLIQLDAGLIFQALKEDQVQAVVGPAIDSRVKAFDLVALRADKPFFPAYNPALVWRSKMAESLPAAVAAGDRLAAALDGPRLTDLVYSVEVELEDPLEAAQKWLRRQGLLTAPGPRTEAQKE